MNAISVRPGRAGVCLPTGETTCDLISGDCLLLGVRLDRRPLERDLDVPPRGEEQGGVRQRIADGERIDIGGQTVAGVPARPVGT